MRPVSGKVPLVPDFDISEFPMEDATITIELNDGTAITVQHARLVASHESGKVVIRFEGEVDDDSATAIVELP